LGTQKQPPTLILSREEQKGSILPFPTKIGDITRIV
jgi:hypothetical protein